MQTYIAVIIALALVVIAFVALKGERGVSKISREIEAEYHKLVDGPSDSGKDGFAPGMAAEMAAENARIDARIGVRHDAAGSGMRQPPHPLDRPVQSRNGVYMSPERLAHAEQQAWAPYSADAVAHYDVRKGSYPGTDLVQQLGHYGESDWGQQLTDIALDKRTKEQHRQWVNEVGPFSQGAFSVDNLDEAVAMSSHRQGIRAFQALTPAQSSCTLQVTELDADAHAKHFKPAYF